jgi:hypothetical protein
MGSELVCAAVLVATIADCVASRASGSAGVAVALHLDLDRSRRDRSRSASRRHQTHHAPRQAGHFAAPCAEKVRVIRASRSVRNAIVSLASPDLEAPDVVAEIRPRDERHICEVDEVPVDRGSVEAELGQASVDLPVAEWRSRSRQKSEDRDARRGALETGTSEAGGVFLPRARRRARAPLRLPLRHRQTLSSAHSPCKVARLSRAARLTVRRNG